MTGPSFPSCLGMYLFRWHLKSEWARGWFNSAPAYEACVHCDVLEVLGGGKGRCGAGMGQADMIMPSLLYYLSPWRPRALCAVCVRSPRRSCLCFWTAAESGVYSKIHLEELRRCQGCREGRNETVIYKPKESGEEECQVNTQGNSNLYIVTWVWRCSACSRSMMNGRPGCWQPISPSGRPSSHMMNTLPFGS